MAAGNAPTSRETAPGDAPDGPATPPPASTAAAWPSAAQIHAQPSERLGPAPGYLASTPLPALGTEVMRITDESMGPGRMFRHEYALRQPWNADGSRLLLTHAPVQLLDGRTYRPIGSLNVPDDAVWSDHDPKLLYGVSGNRLVSRNIATGMLDTIATFAQYQRVYIGGGEGNLSTGDRRVALIGTHANGGGNGGGGSGGGSGDDADGIDILVYDLVAQRTISSRRFAGMSGPWGDIDSAAISPSGRYVLVGVDTPELAWDLYDAETMNLLRRLVVGQRSHADIGYDSNGREVLVTQAGGSSAIVSIRLDNGSIREELPAAAMAWNQHVSCRNNLRPGWCIISTFAHSARRQAWLYRQIVAVRLDGSGTIERYAPAAFADNPVDETYLRQAHAVPSRDGQRVLFASDWAQPQAGAAIHTYVAGVHVR